MKKKKVIDRSVLMLALVGILVLVNLIAVRFFARLDLTEDGQFTLSSATRATLGELRDPVTVRAYFTRDLPPPYSTNARYVRDLLDEYYAESDGSLRYEFIDPMTEESDAEKDKKKDVRRDIFGRAVREATGIERELQKVGIPSVQVRVNEGDKLEVKRAYMGLAVQYGEKTEVLPVVQSTAGLEYDLTTLVRKLTRERRPKIALVTAEAPGGEALPIEKVAGLWGQLYEVSRVNVAAGETLAEDLDAVVVFGGVTPYPVEAQRAIDAFVMGGHAAAFLLAPASPDLKTLQAEPTQHGLGALLTSYGVTVDSSLVMDAECATIQIAQQRGFMQVRQPVRYPFMPLVAQLAAEHPVSRGLGQVVFPFTSPLKVTLGEGSEVEAQVLAHSSAKSWVQAPPYNLDPLQRWTLDGLGEASEHDLVVTLKGPIVSHFAAQGAVEGASAGPARSPGSRLFVAGGWAFATDQFLSPSNEALLLNVVDWMVMDDALLAVRARGLAAAPLSELGASLRRGLKIGNIAGVPLLLVIGGLLRWRMRERRRETVAL